MIIHQIRTPVKREGAGRYLMVTLISFAVSVIVTRVFLQVTNYPQLAWGEIHIAHLLFGGFFLFVAALLPLVLSNRSVFVISAVLSGAGVGLFIDEVGKFITQANDYFYPPAMPIIYAFFLLVTLIYFQVRKMPRKDARAELYRSFDSLSEILDYDLEPHELASLKRRLKYVSQKKDSPAYAELAKKLLKFLDSKDLKLVPQKHNLFTRLVSRLEKSEEEFVGRSFYKAALVLWLTTSGAIAIGDLVRSFTAFFSSEALFALASRLVSSGVLVSDASIYWFLVRLVLEALVGISLIVSAFLLAKGAEKTGISIAYYGILLSLTTVNLLVFYFDQTRAFFSTLGQLTLFLLIIHFRHRFLVLQEIAPE
ncbi:MAG: hypothetical protein UT23_C0016G0007 [Candidatus Woesebacteria bacterium GW2011_GWA1_39_12]|uniref:Uncharacterized protein n=1 Tax=Candidatus Woesebacteria bacterium GW2011_GWA1_39_12 TaxID=1618549 RepID=A0A0G0MA31_9BACT|nr:MAG: hypothetical protein UT23_C0016G0007 [Candidatus Woesebacteria bacterium GW2011_GWA1_39_12]